MKTMSQQPSQPRFLNRLLLAALLVPTLAAAAPTQTFSDRASWNAYVAAAPTTIDFSTRDDSSPVTNPVADAGFSVLSLRGVEFLDVRSYWNQMIYVFPAQGLRVNLPAGTYAFGTDLTPFYPITGTYSVLLSTGESYFVSPAMVPWQWDFFGVHSSENISWVEFSYDNTYLAMDNFSYLRLEQLSVTIDIKPDSPTNPVNPRSNGMLPVVVFGEPALDPYQIDVAGLRFGVTGQEATPRSHSFLDINADGEVDLAVNFRIPDTGMSCTTTQLMLTGTLQNGQVLVGTDNVSPVGCKP